MVVKLGRQGDPLGVSGRLPGSHKLAHDRRDDAISKSRGKLRGPLANRRPGAPDPPPDLVRVATEQGECSRFFHEADDLTTATAAKQTKGHDAANQQGHPTSAEVRRRAPASAESRLIDRLDKAMQVAKVSGPTLAAELDITPQSLTNMRRKANAGMRADLLARAAQFLGCDLYWLCTGEGGDYVPIGDVKSLLRKNFDGWIDRLKVDDYWAGLVVAVKLFEGHWPTFEPGAAPPAEKLPRTRKPSA